MNDALPTVQRPEFHIEAIMGFLPPVVPRHAQVAPLDRLSALVAELPEHYHGAQTSVRRWLDARLGPDAVGQDEVEAMVAAIDGLDVAELDGLATVLGVLGHAYRWDTAPPRPEAYTLTRVVLPPALAAPWARVAARQGVPRVGNLYAMVLCNWRFRDGERRMSYAPEELSEGALEVACPWLRGPERDELGAFVMTALLTEAAGVQAVRTALGLLAAVREEDRQRLHALVDRLQDEVEAMARPFKVLIQKKRLRPESFLRLVQPTTIWGLDEGEGPLEGASGPQVGSLQVLDALLGVPRRGPMAQAIVHSRRYLPPSQVSFLEAFEAEAGSVRAAVEGSGDTLLVERFRACGALLRSWRQMHQKRGALYLRGDGADLPYTSTGGVVALADERVRVFEAAMATRIGETDEALALAAGRVETRAPELVGLRFLQATEREALLALMELRRFTPGERLIQTGARRPGLFVITRGAVRVEADTPGGAHVLGRLGPGALLGESAFLASGTASADVVADGEVEALHVTTDALLDRSDRDPRFALHLFQSLGVLAADRMARTNRHLGRAMRHAAPPGLRVPPPARAEATPPDDAAALVRLAHDVVAGAAPPDQLVAAAAATDTRGRALLQREAHAFLARGPLGARARRVGAVLPLDAELLRLAREGGGEEASDRWLAALPTLVAVRAGAAALVRALATTPEGGVVVSVLHDASLGGAGLPSGRRHLVHVPDGITAAGLRARLGGDDGVQIEVGDPEVLLERLDDAAVIVDRFVIGLRAWGMNDEALERWCSRARRAAQGGARVVVLGLSPALPDAAFVDDVLEWSLARRGAAELTALLGEAGWGEAQASEHDGVVTVTAVAG